MAGSLGHDMALTWLPNMLTLARCGLAGLVAWLILTRPEQSYWPALAFIAIALTDFVDGYAARRLDAVSKFGAFLDPVADKLLVGASLAALAWTHDLALVLLVPTLAIILRDVIATALRLFPSVDLPVSQLAKYKTALEMLAISGLLLSDPLGLAALWPASLILLWLAAALALYTLGLYIGALLADAKRPHS